MTVGSLACRQTPPPDSKTGNVLSDTQILSHFQLQDIQAGTKYMVLDSEEGRLFKEPYVTKLRRPVVTFYKNGAAASVLKAAEGQILMDTREILAWDRVVVVTADSSTLMTERMRYDPQKRRLFSDDQVRLEKPDSVTVGRGLEAEVDLRRVKIGHEQVTIKRPRSSKTSH